MPEVDATKMDAVAAKEYFKELFFEEDDLPYEEDILRNPFAIRCWLRYIEHKRKTKGAKGAGQVSLVYERALKELPGSYKLWYHYLRFRRKLCRRKAVSDGAFEEVNNAFERSLVFMHKMPRIWLDYAQFLMDQGLITRTRRCFDRALRALPATQHDRLWPLYLKFVRQSRCPETAVRVYRRYMKLAPENREEYVEFLLESGLLDEAAKELGTIVNDEKFVSKEGKSHHQLWTDLADLLCKNPDKVTSLKVEPIIRQGIAKYSDQVGKLWSALAEYHIRAAVFEKARDIYEEAIATVLTVRDFTQVFDAYAQLMERLAGGKMEEMAGKAESGEEVSPEEDAEAELLLLRFENLMERRPLLLNSVLLRQNPHNAHEWHKRADLYKEAENTSMVIETYRTAVETVQPKLQTGRLSSLWVAFAKFYEDNGQLDDAREIFESALKVAYVRVEELAAVWCEYGELELRANRPQAAVALMRRATAPPPMKTAYHDETEAVQKRVHKSLKLWSFYADLEESFGTLDSTKRVYNRILDLKIPTPQIIINYALFLEENHFFEEAFQAYEKGIALFRWPNVFDIWNTYLVKFTQRYGGKKLERARDLFEQCLESCPPAQAKNIYLMYAQLEEEHGLARHAMSIYNRGTGKVSVEDMSDMFNIYVKKAAELYGITHTRAIYEKAIEELPTDRSREMCLRFAELERKLGEVDRARAVYAHCSQMCDPRVHPSFWDIWKDFEVRHGNEDTVREMLRVKRSVQATFNTQVNYMSATMLAAAQGAKAADAGNDDFSAGDSMALLEAKAAKMAATSEKASALGGGGGTVAFVRGELAEEKDTQQTANPDEIDIGDEEDDEEGEEEAAVDAGKTDELTVQSKGAGGSAEKPKGPKVCQEEAAVDAGKTDELTVQSKGAGGSAEKPKGPKVCQEEAAVDAGKTDELTVQSKGAGGSAEKPKGPKVVVEQVGVPSEVFGSLAPQDEDED